MIQSGMSRMEVVCALREAHGIDVTYQTVARVTSDLATIKHDITGVKAWLGDRPRRECVMELYDQGLKARAISKQLGLDYTAVCGDISYTKRVREEATLQVERLAFSPKVREIVHIDY